nr:MAG TPA: hypothetical protein [Bacteriophage sp.]
MPILCIPSGPAGEHFSPSASQPVSLKVDRSESRFASA